MTTSTERSRTYRNRLRTEGYYELVARLDPTASKALRRLKKRRPKDTLSTIIGDAVRYYAGMGD